MWTSLAPWVVSTTFCAYFVLDWQHDPFAIPAARAYAGACEATHPALAADLRELADKAERRAHAVSPGAREPRGA